MPSDEALNPARGRVRWNSTAIGEVKGVMPRAPVVKTCGAPSGCGAMRIPKLDHENP